MDSLPLEVQIDILKYLNFKQLISMQQTNIYFNHLINDYENQLARKEFSDISFKFHFNFSIQNCKNMCKPFNPEPELYDFELSEELEEKWKCVIEKSMPLFVDYGMPDYYGQVACILNKNNGDGEEFWDDSIISCNTLSIEFLLPVIPKTIKEMKIARYLFEQLFTCAYKVANFYYVIFNPQMLELLFDDNKTRIPLRVHSHKSLLIKYNDTSILSKFVLNHMRSYHFEPHCIENNDGDQPIEIQLNILKNGGTIFDRISYDYRHSLKLYNLIIKHIETSQDFSKMVKELNLSFTREPIISKTAENIEIKIGKDNLKTTKYQLSNKHSPEIKFSVSVREVCGSIRFDVDFKRIAY